MDEKTYIKRLSRIGKIPQSKNYTLTIDSPPSMADVTRPTFNVTFTTNFPAPFLLDVWMIGGEAWYGVILEREFTTSGTFTVTVPVEDNWSSGLWRIDLAINNSDYTDGAWATTFVRLPMVEPK